MNAQDILRSLHFAGISVRYRDGKIICSPSARLTDELRSQIRAHREEIIRLIHGSTRACSSCRYWIMTLGPLAGLGICHNLMAKRGRYKEGTNCCPLWEEEGKAS